ncbi:MAG: hypothetical protein L0Y71_16835 [Gemmataceae bacterium]|nr:hypothetical protein [Gemmataceae bacterium]
MGQLHDKWKAAKAKIKKSEVAKKFKEKLGEALDKMETKRAEIQRRLEAMPDDQKLGDDEGKAIFQENDAAGVKAAKILQDYIEVVTEARTKYKTEHDSKKDKAKEDAKAKHEEMQGLLRALLEIRKSSGCRRCQVIGTPCVAARIANSPTHVPWRAGKVAFSPVATRTGSIQARLSLAMGRRAE